jgi:hypothetical protein
LTYQENRVGYCAFLVDIIVKRFEERAQAKGGALARAVRGFQNDDLS